VKDWHNAIVGPEVSIREAIGRIDASALQIALIVGESDRLIGVMTDGDVRRAILAGISLDAPVAKAMTTQFTSVGPNDDRASILSLMKQKEIGQVPVVDADGRVVGLETLVELLHTPARPNIAVIMAGGLGSRLGPLTRECPKPMLRVGGRPILETILLNLAEYGISHVYLAVNYRADMVEDYFGDGKSVGMRIEYLRERERLGTAGALGLLPVRPAETFIVMNGDVLTKVNVNHLLEFHKRVRAVATMCVREHDSQVPFGVVALEGDRVVAIQEKPIRRDFVNAGLYAIEPLALDHVPAGDHFDMPSLFSALIDRGHATAAFPVREYWLDIGHHADFERANGDFPSEFGHRMVPE
jgi:dTDP-glucose pyrophosphorylase